MFAGGPQGPIHVELLPQDLPRQPSGIASLRSSGLLELASQRVTDANGLGNSDGPAPLAVRPFLRAPSRSRFHMKPRPARPTVHFVASRTGSAWLDPHASASTRSNGYRPAARLGHRGTRADFRGGETHRGRSCSRRIRSPLLERAIRAVAVLGEVGERRLAVECSCPSAKQTVARSARA